MSVRHTYLFQPGKWRAQGRYYGPQGMPVQAEGEVEIVHGPDKWENRGVMRIDKPGEREYANVYEMQPVPRGGFSGTWTSRNPDLGEFKGKMTVVEDAIIMFSRSIDGAYETMETLTKVSDDRYESRGVLYGAGERLSSWAVTLERESGPIS